MFIDDETASIATGRTVSFFQPDMDGFSEELRKAYEDSTVLVIGGAGSIGAACVREILRLSPERVDVVDINENALASLARAIRSDVDSGSRANVGFYALDFGSWPMERFVGSTKRWDHLFNFAAVKHVRSEKSVPSTLHMLDVNIVKQGRFFKFIAQNELTRNYFAISTDKAADPSSFMGASKRLLEYVVYGLSTGFSEPKVSSARFANVAFSNGSLLESFRGRLETKVPLACPKQTYRYFISPKEAAQICMIGMIKSPNRAIAVPKMTPEQHLVSLESVVESFLKRHDFKTEYFTNVEAAYAAIETLRDTLRYPVLLTPRDTAGEKEVEVFVGEGEERFQSDLQTIDFVTASVPTYSEANDCYSEFLAMVDGVNSLATLDDIRAAVSKYVPEFKHMASVQLLDDRI